MRAAPVWMGFILCVLVVATGCQTMRSMEDFQCPADSSKDPSYCQDEDRAACYNGTGSSVVVTVDQYAVPQYSCVKVSRKNKTAVVWNAGGNSDVETLCVTILPTATNQSPKQPMCNQSTCTLPPRRQDVEEEGYCYVVKVRLKDGTIRETDPVLIINP